MIQHVAEVKEVECEEEDDGQCLEKGWCLHSKRSKFGIGISDM